MCDTNYRKQTIGLHFYYDPIIYSIFFSNNPAWSFSFFLQINAAFSFNICAMTIFFFQCKKWNILLALILLPTIILYGYVQVLMFYVYFIFFCRQTHSSS